MDKIGAAVTIAAPSASVFGVLADPATHAAIDGTGWIQKPVDQEKLTEVGQVFRMDMYHSTHPDGNYQVANEILVLDAPRAIAWRTGSDPKGDGNLEFGGWFWRYDLVELGPSDTEVTLSYDWSAVPQSIRDNLSFPPFEPEHLTNSLLHLTELATAQSA